MPATLLCTLGSEPQVVTLTADLLHKQQFDLQRVVVVHTDPSLEPIRSALATLQAEFDRPGALPLQLIPLTDVHGAPLADVDTELGAAQVFRTLYRAVRTAKLGGQAVHLCVAGGRKTMAVFGMAVAQLLFDDTDTLWHLVSAGDLLKEKRLHAQPGDDVRLIPIPVILWNQLSPVLTDLHDVDDPFIAAERVQALHLRKRMDDARAFVLGSLTPAEARTVALLVRDGLPDVDIAQRLVVSPRTVEHHLRVAYEKARIHWGLEAVSRAQLISLTAYYFNLHAPQPAEYPGKPG